MGRHVDTSWYDTYVQSKAVEPTQGVGTLSDPELAGILGIKPKTWARVKAAGRFLDGLRPVIKRERIQCGYAPLERLAKLWSLAPDAAPDLLDAVLSNQIKLADLESLIRGHAEPNSPRPEPTRRPRPAQALFSRLERFFDSSKLHPFDCYKGRVVRRKGTLGAPSGYFIYNSLGERICLVLCVQTSAWRDPATTARELYEHALAQRHLARDLWFVFDSDNPVLQRLAELSLYWGGSPYDTEGHWLSLSHFIDTGALQVLFEDHFAQLIERINSGQRLIGEAELRSTLDSLDGQPAPKPVPVRPVRKLPKPDKTRDYRKVVQERQRVVGSTPSATHEEKRGRLEADLDL